MEHIEQSANASSGTLAGSFIKTYLIGVYLIAFAAASLLLTACGSFNVSLEDRGNVASESPQVENPSPTPEPQPSAISPVDVDEPGPFYISEPSFYPGAEDDLTILKVEDGAAALGSSPVDMGVLWDYSGPSGRIAYASEFYHASQAFSRSVTDLWVYDYGSDTSERWLEDDVAQAYWSPYLPGSTRPQELAAAVFDSESGTFNLMLIDSPGQTRQLARCSSTEFSFSPDGTQIAYKSGWYNEAEPRPQECTGVFIVDVEDGTARRLTGTDPLATGGWHRDQPLWAESLDALLFKSFNEDSIFNIVPLDGSGWSRVINAETIAEEYLPSPFLSLWSDAHRSVIGQTEGMFDPQAVWVYQFSPDGDQIVDAFRVNWGEFRHDLLLLGWWDVGESVLIRDISNTSELNPLGEVVIWSIAERAVVDTVSTKPDFMITLYPNDASTGMPELDHLLQAFLEGDAAERAALIETITAACTNDTFVVGPPPCEPGMSAGTVVERFPYRRYREQRYANMNEIVNLMDFDIAGLYAVLKDTGGGVASEFYPFGEYHLLLVSDTDQRLIDILATDGHVVLIEFWEITPPEVYSNFSGQYILPPL